MDCFQPINLIKVVFSFFIYSLAFKGKQVDSQCGSSEESKLFSGLDADFFKIICSVRHGGTTELGALKWKQKKNLNCLLQAGMGRGRRDKKGLHDMKDQEQLYLYLINL